MFEFSRNLLISFLPFLIIIILFIFFMGIRFIKPDQKAVVYRLGKRKLIIEKPGFYWIIPLLDKMEKYDKDEPFYEI